MHSSGSITRKFGPSWKQSTGHTSTQSVYLHLMQFSVTTKGMAGVREGKRREDGRRRQAPGHRDSLAIRGPSPQPGLDRWARLAQRKSPRIAARASELVLPTGFEPVLLP